MKNQRMMLFMENIDSSPFEKDTTPAHQFSLDFSRKYIKGKKVLNVGSWTGPFEALIVNIAKNITSTDIEEKALNVLKKYIPSVTVKKAYSHMLPFPDKSFDVVTFWAVIEHIPVGYELASLREMRRVLKPGGYLFISTMHKQIYSDILDPAYWLVGHRHYSKFQLTEMLKDAGFVIEKTSIHGSFLTAFDVIVFYIFKHIFRIRKPHIGWLQKKIDRDYNLDGFYEIAVRSRAT